MAQDTGRTYDTNIYALDEANNCPVTFINIENPYDLDVTGTLDPQPQSHSRAMEDETQFQDESTQFQDETTAHFHDESTTQFQDAASLSPTPAPDDRTATPPANPQPRIDPNIMGLYLLRHFKEGPGQWCVHLPRHIPSY